MRNILLLILITVFQVNADDIYSQNTRISLSLNNVPIAKVLEEIQNNSEFYFLFNAKLIDVERDVSISVSDMKISEILSSLFSGTGVNWVVYDRQIILTPGDAIGLSEIIQQLHKVSGTVTDKDGSPLPGVNVVIKGTSQGVITDVNGKYNIEVPQGVNSLVFSFIGMEAQEIVIGSLSQIDVIMLESAIGLEEVIVVGYGTQKKVNITGAVSTVSATELEARPITNVGEAIRGLVPNLQINTVDGGRPGSSLNWQIRGVGSIGGANDAPLILIDGIAGNPDDINPDDIENISVLKDAAASAIYGSRAPYGVVIITTKKGKQEQMKVTLHSNYSFRMPTEMLNKVGSLDWIDLTNEGFTNNGLAPLVTQATIDHIKYKMEHPEENLPDVYPDAATGTNWYGLDGKDWIPLAVDVDWWSECYKSKALTQNHNLSAQGGSKAVTYYASLGYFDEDGLYRHGNDYYKRYNGLFNVQAQATEWLDLDFRFRLTRNETSRPSSHAAMVQDSYRFWPLWPIRSPNGDYMPEGASYLIADEGAKKNTTKDVFVSTLAFSIKPLKGLNFNGDVTFNSFDSKYHENGKILYLLKPDGKTIKGTYNGANKSYVNKSYSLDKFYSVNLYASYARSFSDGHNLLVLAGYQNEYQINEGVGGYRDALISQDLPSLSAATGTDIRTTDSGYEWSSQGYFGRLTYNYKEKYLFEFNSRYDGSSRFPEDLRWGFFPSASVGYNISKESFFDSFTSIIDLLKLRASYGRLGNSNVGYYYVPTISKYQNNFIGPGGVYLDYVSAPGLGNYGLTWEKPTTLNLGLDLSMFDNSIQVTAELFNRKTIDMVGPSEPLPAVLGTSVPSTNNTELKGQGWELTLTYRRAINDFHFQAMFNISHHRETVLKYYNPKGLINSYYEGKVLGEIWGYETEGFISDLDIMPDQTQVGTNWKLGDIQYKDQLTVDTNGDGIPDAGDGKITVGAQTLEDHGDLIRIGNSTPDFDYNFSLDCDYRGFDFRVFLSGLGHTDWWPSTGQGDLQTATQNIFFGQSNQPFNHPLLVEHLDHWTPENPNGYFPRVHNGWADYGAKNRKTQTRYLQNRAYLRMKNIQIGYTLPSKWTKPYLIENARIYISGENLLTFSNLMIFDPETPGLIYPLQKVISAGIKLSF